MDTMNEELIDAVTRAINRTMGFGDIDTVTFRVQAMAAAAATIERLAQACETNAGGKDGWRPPDADEWKRRGDWLRYVKPEVPRWP